MEQLEIMQDKNIKLNTTQTPIIRLRPYQEEAIFTILRYYNHNVRKQLVILPTGTGKTIIFASLIDKFLEDCINNYHKIIVLAHRDELIRQAVNKISLLVDRKYIGIIKADQNDIEKPVLVCSVQTLQRENRLKELSKETSFVFMLITDEAHHAVANSYIKIYNELLDDNTLHVGFTATGFRSDNIALGNVFDKIVYEKNLLDFIPDYLVNLKIKKIKTNINLDSINTVNGDFNQTKLAKILDTENYIELITKSILKFAMDRLTLVFAPSVKSAYDIADLLKKKGVKAEAVSSNTPLDERRKILRKFQDKEIQVVTNYAILTEGYDNPAINCIVMARPTLSPVLYMQMLGRGTRKYPDKDDCLILDIAHLTDKYKLVNVNTLLGLPIKDNDDLLSVKKRLEEEKERIEEIEEDIPPSVEKKKGGNVIAVYTLTEKDFEGLSPKKKIFEWIQIDRDWFLEIDKNIYIQLRTWDYEGGLLTEYGLRIIKLDYGVYEVLEVDKTDNWGHTLTLDWAFELGEAKAIKYWKDNKLLHYRFTLNNTKAMWRKKPPTERQLKAIKKFYPKLDISTIKTRGEANKLITQKILKQKILSVTAPTTAQIKFLEKIGHKEVTNRLEAIKLIAQYYKEKKQNTKEVSKNEKS